MINLDKGSKISLDKDLGGIRTLRLGVGWFPMGYTPRRFRKESAGSTTTETKKSGGFLNTLGDMFKGNARIGDVVNSAIDSGKNVVDTISDNLDMSISSDAMAALEDVDVDTTVIFLSDGVVIEKVAYDVHSAFNGAVKHSGDNTTGKGKDMEADKEFVTIDFSKLPSKIDEAIMFVNVYGASSRNQHFGKFGGGFARVSNQSGEELAFFNLNADEYNKQEGIYLLRVYSYNGDWRVEVLGTACRNASHYRDMITGYKTKMRA